MARTRLGGAKISELGTPIATNKLFPALRKFVPARRSPASSVQTRADRCQSATDLPFAFSRRRVSFSLDDVVFQAASIYLDMRSSPHRLYHRFAMARCRKSKEQSHRNIIPPTAAQASYRRRYIGDHYIRHLTYAEELKSYFRRDSRRWRHGGQCRNHAEQCLIFSCQARRHYWR